MTTTFIKGGPIFDVAAGAFVEDRAIVVEGERIAEIAPLSALPAESGARVVDVAGRHLLPGLIDSHYHLMSRSQPEVTDDRITLSVLEAVKTSRQAIEAGLTTVRDPGCKHLGIFTLRDEIAAGRVIGPRAYVAGPNVTGSFASPEWRNAFADGPDEVRKVVRKAVLAGADFIKLILSHEPPADDWRRLVRFLTDAEIEAAVSEAHAIGRPLGCHCEGIEAARAAVEAGMDTLDHGTVIDEALAARMAERGTALVPTLWAYRVETQIGWGVFGEDQRERYEREFRAEHLAAFRNAVAAGVTIGAGSDSIIEIPERDATVLELEALRDAGLPPADVLRAATINGARIIGLEDRIGSLEAGKLADVIAVDGDPLSDLRVLERPAFVIKAGTSLIENSQFVV